MSLTRPWLYAAILLLTPSAARAADDGGHFMWEVVNLVLLVAVLVFVARKPVLGYLADRREGIERNLAESEKLLIESQARLEEWNAKAAQLDAEVTSIKAQALKAAEHEAAQIVAAAEVSAERIRTSAGAVIDRELNHAQEKLREEAADMAVKMASRILAQNVTDDDKNRLVDEFIAKIEQGPQGGTH